MVSRNSIAQSNSGVGNVIPNTEFVQMAMSYARSHILWAAARLGVADALADEVHGADDLGKTCQANWRLTGKQELATERVYQRPQVQDRRQTTQNAAIKPDGASCAPLRKWPARGQLQSTEWADARSEYTYRC